METKSKILISELLLFAAIGFSIYLLAIVVSFLGCCVGITQVIFDTVLLVLAISGFVAFGVCSYFTCFKKKIENR